MFIVGMMKYVLSLTLTLLASSASASSLFMVGENYAAIQTSLEEVINKQFQLLNAYGDTLSGYLVDAQGNIIAETDEHGVLIVNPTSVEDIHFIPRDIRLRQNYPNPFNTVTTIAYSLDRHSMVQLRIFNLLGQKVATIVQEQQPPGSYTYQWTPELASGLYFYQLTVDDLVMTRKMLLVK